MRQACDNCKYFSFRFYRAEYNYFVALGEGNCGVKKYTEEERAKLPFDFVCDKWTRKNCKDTDMSQIKDELSEITAKLIAIVKELPN